MWMSYQKVNNGAAVYFVVHNDISKGFLMFHCTHLATTPSRQNKYKINSLSGTTLCQPPNKYWVDGEMGDRRLKDSSSVVEFLFRPSSRPPWEITSSCLAWLPLKKAELNYLASIQSVTKGQSAGWKNRSRSLDTVFLLLIFGQNLGFFRTSWHLPFPIFLVKSQLSSKPILAQHL